MFEPEGGQALSIALFNAVLLALWAVLPALLLSYTRLSLVARRIRPEFSLRKSEAIELQRAVLLFEKVCLRFKEIDNSGERTDGLWHALFKGQTDIRRVHADELEDLEAHAQHLRATIMRLKSRPLQRLRSWLQIKSSQFALGCALAAHIVGLALTLTVVFQISERSAWADDLTTGVRNVLVWYPLDERFFYANAVAAVFAAVAAPVFYVTRRASLRRQYRLEFCVFKDLAHADPGQPVDQPQAEEAAQDESQRPEEKKAGGDCDWFAILGLSQSATIEEVKEAYKTLIRQNHPDKVHGMSPAFRKLAESETKKINVAYQQALVSAHSL